jgi:hypothetical protein
MDEVCTMGTLLETTRDSETQRTLTPSYEETWKTSHDPWKTRETKTRQRFFRTRPDGIAHHNKKKIWYLMEFKRTSDVLPNYLEKKDNMSSKQYENFMNMLRKAKNPDWTSEQINFIVVSKTINESVMDINLDKIDINQKNKQKIKAKTVKTNIHSLLNILRGNTSPDLTVIYRSLSI